MMIGDNLTVVRNFPIWMFKPRSVFLPPCRTIYPDFRLAIRSPAASFNLFRFPPVGQPDNVISTEVPEVVYQALQAGFRALPR